MLIEVTVRLDDGTPLATHRWTLPHARPDWRAVHPLSDPSVTLAGYTLTPHTLPPAVSADADCTACQR